MTHTETPAINLADFAAFCRSKGAEEYPWCSTTDCALGQYARYRFPDAAWPAASALGDGITVDGERFKIEGLPKGFVYDCIAIPGETGSFAALAKRLDALVSA